MVCFHCDHKRPHDEFMENQRQERERGPRTGMEKVSRRDGVSNAWNFNFDDDESDGADVAAFEYADSSRMRQDAPLDDLAQGRNFRGPEDDFKRDTRRPGGRERENQDPDVSRPRMGFDDFDDEDDDVDSYELDTSSGNPAQNTSSIDFSELEEYSGSEDIDGFDENFPGGQRTKSSKSNKTTRPMHQKAGSSGFKDDEIDLDSDDELSANPKWKSSHVADSRQRGRGAMGPSRGLSYGSDDDHGLGSVTDDDLEEDFGSSRRNKWGSGRRNHRREGSESEDECFSGSESNYDDRRSYRSRAKANNAGGSRDFRPNRMRGGRRNSFDDEFDRSLSQRSHGKNRGGFQGNDYDNPRISKRAGNSQDFNRGRGFGSRQGGSDRNFNRGEGFGRRQGGRDRDFNGEQEFGTRQGGRDRNFNGGREFGRRQGGRDRDFRNQSGENWDFDRDRQRRQRIIER